MSAPRVDIDLAKIQHNASTLVDRLGARGVAVTAVTKATLGSPEIAAVLVRAGVHALGDSRIENLELLRLAGVQATMTLIRSPMASQAARVVDSSDISLNTEVEVLRLLSEVAATQGRIHGVILMVELGDLREGIMPVDLEDVARTVVELPGLTLVGIGTNLACQNGVVPDSTNMAELSALAEAIEASLGIALEVVSGGNSANLDWATSATDLGRINDLRLGESILLGREPLERTPVAGLHQDAFTVVAEVIESIRKPHEPWGQRGQNAMGEAPSFAAVHDVDAPDAGAPAVSRAILALGHQDVDPLGLQAPAGITIIGASSDHLVVGVDGPPLEVGDEVAFQPTYGALVRAMTSPFVTKVLHHSPEGRHLAIVTTDD